MEKVSNRTFINAFIIIALFMFTIAGALTYIQFKKLLDANFWVIHTYQVMDEARQIKFDLQIAQTTLNSKILSKMTPLQDILVINKNIFSHINEILELAKDNPIQGKKIATFKINVTDYFELLKNLATSAAHTDAELKKAELLSQDLNEKIMIILLVEKNLLDGRETTVKHNITITSFIIIASILLAEFLIIICLILINYHLSQLAKAEIERSDSDARLRRMINSSSDLICAVDTKMRLIAANTAFENKIKKTFGQAIKIDFLEEIYSSNQYGKLLISAWKKGLQGKEVTLTTPTDDNKNIFYEITVNPIRDKNNKIIGASSIMRNITERMKVDQLKNEFVSIVSHELRTPLTSIRGSLGLLLGGSFGPVNEKSEQMLQIAVNNCERLIQLINDILDIEKIESGKMEFQFTVFNLEDLIADAINSNEQYAKKFNVKLLFEKTNLTILVKADYGRIMQVLANLISNAVKFSPTNGVVIVYLQTLDETIKVCIHDQGQGIDDDFKNRIFQKFAQADSSSIRLKGGTGLGLNICKMIIEKHNGIIDFESEEGNTTFYFELPIYQKQAELPSDIFSLTTQSAPSFSHHKPGTLLQVLHIEDDADLSQVIKDVLKNEAKVTSAYTVESAMHELEKQRFDLVILDIKLRQKSALEIIPKITKQNIPIIVFSAYELPQDYRPFVKEILLKSKTSNEKILQTVLTIARSNEIATR